MAGHRPRRTARLAAGALSGLFHGLVLSRFEIPAYPINLGHATASFTLDVYGHCTDQMKPESANRMERFISGLG